MTPITSSTRRLAAYVGVWLIGGCALAGVFVNAELAQWQPALVFALPMAVFLGFVAASAYYVCRSVVLTQRGGFQTVVVFGASSALAALLWALIRHGRNTFGASLLALAGAALITGYFMAVRIHFLTDFSEASYSPYFWAKPYGLVLHI